MAGLYKRSLSASGNSATVQAIAARCGARLVNLEFMQIMPGLVAPRRNIVFNEKGVSLRACLGRVGEPIACDVLEARSEHGPFSCERAGAPLDFAMEACGDEGMEITCDVGDGSPEFVRIVFRMARAGMRRFGERPCAHCAVRARVEWRHRD